MDKSQLEIKRVRLLLLLGHAVLAIGLIFSFIPYTFYFWPDNIANTEFPYYFPAFVMVFSSVLYSAALLADKKDKIIKPRHHTAWLIWAFMPAWLALLFSGVIFVWIAYVLNFFHLWRPLLSLLGIHPMVNHIK